MKRRLWLALDMIRRRIWKIPQALFSVLMAQDLWFWYEVKDYMQVESPLKTSEKESEEDIRRKPLGAGTGSGIGRNSGNSSQNFGADEKELEAIFTRTYGEKGGDFREKAVGLVTFDPKKQGETSYGPDRIRSHGNPGYMKKQQEPEEEYLLVDGYNILYAREDMRELMQVTLDGARHRLMDILCNYQGYRKCNLIVVFDAYKVPGGVGSAQDYHNIHVVYTKRLRLQINILKNLLMRWDGDIG